MTKPPCWRKVNDILAIAGRNSRASAIAPSPSAALRRRPQVSTRTLYNHFTDKSGLFTACIEAGAANFARLLSNMVTSVWQRRILFGYSPRNRGACRPCHSGIPTGSAGAAPTPDSATLKLTLRSFDPDVRKLLSNGVATTAKAVAEW